MKRIALILAALSLIGCTHMSFNPKTGQVQYWQCLQNKTIQYESPDGTKAVYSSDNTPVIVLGEKAGELVKTVK